MSGGEQKRPPALSRTGRSNKLLQRDHAQFYYPFRLARARGMETQKTRSASKLVPLFISHPRLQCQARCLARRRQRALRCSVCSKLHHAALCMSTACPSKDSCRSSFHGKPHHVALTVSLPKLERQFQTGTGRRGYWHVHLIQPDEARR